MMMCARSLICSRLTSTFLARRSLISSISTSGSTTTPFPITGVTCGQMTPEGMRWNLNSPVWFRTVWPALFPPE